LKKREVPYEDYIEATPAPNESSFRNIELYNAMMRLTEKHRLCITLHYIEGFKTAEIAEILKIPEGTVKSRLSKARAELRLLLNDDEEEYSHEVG